MINSTIVDCDSSGDILGVLAAGGIVGLLSDSTINASFSGGKVNGYVAGGIAGSVTDSTIRSCYSTGNVTAEMDAGGIAGAVYGNSTISGSYGLGYIKSETSEDRASQIVGGYY